MGYFQSISLKNYRNFLNSSFEFNERCNVIVGKNGSGKTNILESISLFEKGRGFRKEKILNLINFQNNDLNFKIHSKFYHNNNDYDVQIFNDKKIEKNSKKILINDSSDPSSLKHFQNLLSFIYFLPEMERLFVSSPSMRRNFIDRLIYTNNKNYNSLINRYKNSIIERYKILKNPVFDKDWIDQLEKNIVIFGSEIYQKRLEQIKIINLILSKLNISKQFSHKFLLKINDSLLENNPNIYTFDQHLFSLELKKNRKIDCITGGCGIGPHRSDINGYKIDNNFNINQLSTGQQKTVILLIIIAQCKYLITQSNLSPIILLDEVCSHLDNENRELLMYLIDELEVQVFMTGTEKNFFSFLSTKAHYCNIT